MASRMVQDATIRNLEVIGEAVKGLSEQTRSRAPGVPWRRIAGMRDQLIHHYFGVDLEVVWRVVEAELGPLRQAVDRLLDEQRRREKNARPNQTRHHSVELPGRALSQAADECDGPARPDELTAKLWAHRHAPSGSPRPSPCRCPGVAASTSEFRWTRIRPSSKIPKVRDDLCPPPSGNSSPTRVQLLLREIQKLFLSGSAIRS
jgi:hypothetical protein